MSRLLCITKPYSTSNMFVSRGIPSFAELFSKAIYRSTKRIELSSNFIIAACLSPLLYISSPVRKWWSSVLYVNWLKKCMYVRRPTGQLVLPIVFVVHLFNIVFYNFFISIWTIFRNKVLLLKLLKNQLITLKI